MSKYDDQDLPAMNSIFHGQVASVQKYGVFVEMQGFKRHGLVHISQMSSARIEDPAEMVAKGEKVFVKVVSVETEGSKIGLSMKLVNQTSGQDLDPNNVTQSQDERKRKTFFAGQKPPIVLGDVYDTKCKHCGGHGHLAMECFVGKGGQQYDLVPELEDMVPSPPPPPDPGTRATRHESPPRTQHKKKKKKEKKNKKEKQKKKRRHASSSESNDNEEERRHSVKKKKKRRYSSSSSESSDSEEERRRSIKKKKKRRHSSSSDSDHHQHRKHKKSSHKHRS